MMASFVPIREDFQICSLISDDAGRRYSNCNKILHGKIIEDVRVRDA